MGRSNKRDTSRQTKSFSGPQSWSYGPKEMHKAKCAECGNECEVPFVPKEGRPVYCKDCYRKRRPW